MTPDGRFDYHFVDPVSSLFSWSIFMLPAYSESQYGDYTTSSSYRLSNSKLDYRHCNCTEVLSLARSRLSSDGWCTMFSFTHFESIRVHSYGERPLYPAFSPDGGVPQCSTRTAFTNNMDQLCA
ncbi:hypothetical protein IG631_21472 [Alternaria alternata]|nr:hypothetical protein IG631_21472 [Alternaria alternata]